MILRFKTDRLNETATVLLLHNLRNLGCLGSGISWFNWWVSFTPDFQCCYFCVLKFFFFVFFLS